MSVLAGWGPYSRRPRSRRALSVALDAQSGHGRGAVGRRRRGGADGGQRRADVSVFPLVRQHHADGRRLGDANAVELGVQFSSATSGFISGVRFFKATTNTGEHIGSLWSSDGTLLAQATFSERVGERVAAGHRSRSRWPSRRTPCTSPDTTPTRATTPGDEGYFSGGAFTNDPLTAPGNGVEPERRVRLQPDADLPVRHLQRRQLLGRRRLLADGAHPTTGGDLPVGPERDARGDRLGRRTGGRARGAVQLGDERVHQRRAVLQGDDQHR